MADFKATFGLDGSGYKEGVAQIVNETRKAKEATENYKGQLKALQREITDLTINYSNLTEAERNSARGQEMLQHLNALKDKAGEIRDVVADMNVEINALASDTPKLDAFAEGVNLISAAMSSAYSITQYFSDSEEDATEATKKLNDMIKTLAVIQTTANAAIQIYNALQKQSALMVGIRKAQEWLLTQSLKKRSVAQTAVVATSNASTAATTANTVATAANTVATNTATVATEGLTLAQKAFNVVAKANPYVLLATVIIAAGSALYYFIQKNEEATEAQKKENEELEKQKDKLDSYAKSVGDSVAKSMVTYDRLRTQWMSLKTTMEKNQFLRDNSNLINELGLGFRNLVDAENAFGRNTEAVKEYFLLRAEAASLAKATQEVYAEYYSKKIKEGILNKKYKGNGKTIRDFTDEELKSVGITVSRSILKGTIFGNNNVTYKDNLTGKKITELDSNKLSYLNNMRHYKYLEDNGLGNEYIIEKYDKLEAIKDLQKNLDNRIKELQKRYPYLKESGKSTTTTPKEHKTPKEESNEKKIKDAEEEYAKSLETISKKKKDSFYTGEKAEEEILEDQLSAVNTLIRFYYDYTESGKKLTNAEQSELLKHIQLRDALKKQISEKEEAIEKEKQSASQLENGIKNLNEKISKLKNDVISASEVSKESTISISKRYKSSIRNYSPEDSSKSYQDVEKFKDLTNRYDNLNKTLNNLRSQYNALNEERNKFLKDNPGAKIDPIEFDTSKAESQLLDLSNQIDKVAKKIQNSFDFKLNKLSNELENVNGLIGNVSTINDWADSWRTVGDRMEEAESGFERFGIVLQQTMSTIQMVSSILDIINTVTKWFTASTIASTTAQTSSNVAQTQKIANDVASVGPATAATTALKLQEAAYIDMAAAAMFAAHASIPFAGVGIASGMISTMMGVLTSVKAESKLLAAFENGGIVGGNSWHGDNLQVRVNSGEMIINKSQQNKLWKLINNGGQLGGYTEVNFKVKGTDLVGVLNNYNSKKSRI